jgi:hypothetical protein
VVGDRAREPIWVPRTISFVGAGVSALVGPAVWLREQLSSRAARSSTRDRVKADRAGALVGSLDVLIQHHTGVFMVVVVAQRRECVALGAEAEGCLGWSGCVWWMAGCWRVCWVLVGCCLTCVKGML